MARRRGTRFVLVDAPHPPLFAHTRALTAHAQLDVYYPPPRADGDGDSRKEATPVLFFVYGGGFNTGDRSIAPRTFGLVYACVAAFFARRGCVVVVPDYRLVPHVVFPGGAEDVRDEALALMTCTEDTTIATAAWPDITACIVAGPNSEAMATTEVCR